MKLLDTDILTLFAAGDPKVINHVQSEVDIVATTVITKIEVLRGRFDALMKAADGHQLEIAQQRLIVAERDLAKFTVLPIDSASAVEFDQLRKQRKLRKIGRADLLIASIALGHKATLVTRNLRHFRKVQGLKAENWAD